MLDKIENDICDILNKHEGYQFTERDCLLANKVMFAFLNSYAWKDEFNGVEMRISKENPLYSEIHLPELLEPDGEDRKVIRGEEKINVFSFLYEYPEIYDYEDEEKPMREPFPRGFMDDSDIWHSLAEKDVVGVIEKLREKNSFYQKIFETDPVKIRKNIDELYDIDYFILEENELDKISDFTNTDQYESSEIKSIFGHRYYSHSDKNRKLICGKNWLGVVGLCSIFNHDNEGVMEKSPYVNTISYVSVSPSYRNMGISKEMFRMAIEMSIEEGKILRNTEYTEIGEKFIKSSFSKFKEDNYPDMAFVEYEGRSILSECLRHDGFENLSKKNRYRFINDVFSLSEDELKGAGTFEVYDYSKSDKFKSILSESFMKYDKNKIKNLDNNENSMSM